MEIAIRSKWQQRAWHRGPSAPHVNPAEETIGLGPLTVCFFGSPEGIGCGSIAAFQVIVPGAQRLAAPAHSHDHMKHDLRSARITGLTRNLSHAP